MIETTSRVARAGVAAFLVLTTGSRPSAQEEPPRVEPECSVDLSLPGQMKDVLSNALLRGLRRPEPQVAAFLLDAEQRYATGPELLRATAAHFGIGEAVLSAEVQRFEHCNCDHGSGDGAPAAVTQFARDVTLHVVLHELGHALVREFDLPVLGNEETVADAFATCYLTTYLPDRAVDVLSARVTSLMIEAGDAAAIDWSGEHEPDARRAFRIAALAVAADAERYAPVAGIAGMSEADVRSARDYGAEIHRSWRRVLAPLWMPDGLRSDEARVRYDATDPFLAALCADGLAAEVESAVRRFDWHSSVTVRFVEGDGGAGWSRSERTVTVHAGYVRRFVEQGDRARAVGR